MIIIPVDQSIERSVKLHLPHMFWSVSIINTQSLFVCNARVNKALILQQCAVFSVLNKQLVCSVSKSNVDLSECLNINKTIQSQTNHR